MKTMSFKGITLGITGILLLACNQKKEEPAAAAPVADKEQIKTEIQALENDFVEAYNNKSIDKVTYYAEDAVSFLQGNGAMKGRSAIMESLKKDAESAPKGEKFSFTTDEVFPSADGNQVLEIGTYILKDSTDTTLTSGHYMSLFEKKDGKYVCIRDMGSSDKPKNEK